MSLHMEIWNSGEKEKMMNECENFIFYFMIIKYLQSVFRSFKKTTLSSILFIDDSENRRTQKSVMLMKRKWLCIDQRKEHKANIFFKLDSLL